jgi:hypothetical protein
MLKIKFDRLSLFKKIKTEVDREFKERTTKLLKDLEEATPVDTGLAKESWSLEFTDSTTAVVSNSQEYIDYLNKGSSKQAPRYFIERTIMNNGFKVKELITTKK